jgi:hypothetical protein
MPGTNAPGMGTWVQPVSPPPTRRGAVAKPAAPAVAVAWRAVLLTSATVFGVLMALSPWYGYYRDELYFRLLAEHPAWGYVDQPPLTPLLAKASIWAFGDTVTALRIPAALATAGTVILAGMVAAEMGGGRWAQLLTALATATGLYPLLVGHTLLTSSADLVAWVAMWLLAARALLRADGRYWLGAGAVFGLALFNKYLIVLLGVGIVVGLVLLGPRRVPREKQFLAGFTLAVLIGCPNLIYQAMHGWPQMQMASALSAEGGMSNRLFTLPGQLILIGLPMVPVLVAGLVGLFREPRWRLARGLAGAHLVVLALVLASNGRLDYAAASLVPLLAVGMVRLEPWASRVPGKRWMLAGIAANGLCSVLIVLPVLPPQILEHTPIPRVNPEARDVVGWPRLVAEVAQVQDGLPEQTRSSDVLLARDYGEAGALDRYGGRYTLPQVYSGHNELAQWRPPASAESAVAVGVDPGRLARFFSRCHVATWSKIGAQAAHTGADIPITVCRGRHASWSAVWPELTHLG